MKCPKCGSEYHIGGTDVNGDLVCRACQLKELKEFGLLNNAQYPELYSTKTFNSVEPTTAEMLLWLVENAQEIVEIDKFRDSYTISVDRAGYESCQVVSRKTLTEAIKQAYEWATAKMAKE